jgi:adhesin/invasin
MANGAASSRVRAIVRDAFGNNVKDALFVNFSAVLGSIDPFAITATVDDTNGVAEVNYTAGIVTGTELITATCSGITGFTRINLYDSDVDEITLDVTPFELIADGRSRANITGRVTNTSGNPVSNGTQVLLSTSPDSMGSASARTVYTTNGDFSGFFISGRYAGTVWVRASVGAISDSASVDLIPGDPDSIAIVASIGSLPSDGSSVDTLRGTVYDRYNNRVRAGVSVTLTSTLGTVFPAVVTTNSNGDFIAYVRSGTSTGMCRIFAQSALATGECIITFVPNDVFTISLTGDPRILVADGFSESELIATVLDSLGRNIADGTPVRFTMTPDTLGVIIPAISYTENGKARSLFRCGDQSGTVTITATCGSLSNTIFITLRSGEVADIVMNTYPDSTITSISANGRDDIVVAARLFDALGNTVLAGKTVNFATTLGTVSPLTAITNSDGVAFTTLKAGTIPGTARVSSQSGTVYEVMEIEFRQSRITTIDISAQPRDLIADGTSTSAVTVSVYDEDGSPVTDGTRVNFAVRGSRGSIVSPKLTNGGTVVTTYTSDTRTGTGMVWLIAQVIDTVPATPDTIIDSTWVRLIPGNPDRILVFSDPSDTLATIPDTIFADNVSDIWISARLYDSFGNRLKAGVSVDFATDLGTITATSVTDSSGTAQARLRAGFTPGTANITAITTSTSGTRYGSCRVVFAQTPVGLVSLFADSTTLTADGVSTTRLRAEVYTATGTPVSDGITVSFTSSNPTACTILPNTGVTDSGKVIVTLRSGSVATPNFIVTATSGTPPQTGTLSMRTIPGAPARIVVRPSVATGDTGLAHISADGISTYAVICSVFDANSNKVSSGKLISFSPSLGTMPPALVTNDSGVVNTVITAGTTPGLSTITVSCGTATGYGLVTFDVLNASTLTLMASPIVIPASGATPSTITAHVLDAGGIPVSDGTAVSFSIDTSSTRLQDAIILPSTGFTRGGTVTATLTPTGRKGTCRVIASAGGQR